MRLLYTYVCMYVYFFNSDKTTSQGIETQNDRVVHK